MKISWEDKGSAGGGTLYVVLIMLIVGALAFEMMGGKLPTAQPVPPQSDSSQLSPAPSQGWQEVIIDPFVPQSDKKNLQLYTFSGHKPVPTTPLPTTTPTTCEHSAINQEDTMIIGFDPGYDKSVGAGGDIRVWFTDENPPMVSIGEVVDPATGEITKKGNTGILDTCSTGKSLNIPFEPSLTIGDKVSYPNKIKGIFYPSSTCTYDPKRKGPNGPSIDDFKPYQAGTPGFKHYGAGKKDSYVAEYIWHVSSLSLSSGNYKARIIAHDGDREIGMLCANITIQ